MKSKHANEEWCNTNSIYFNFCNGEQNIALGFFFLKENIPTLDKFPFILR